MMIALVRLIVYSLSRVQRLLQLLQALAPKKVNKKLIKGAMATPFDDVIGVMRTQDKEIQVINLIQTKRHPRFSEMAALNLSADPAANFLTDKVKTRPEKLNPNLAMIRINGMHGESLRHNVNALMRDGCPSQVAKIFAYALEFGALSGGYKEDKATVDSASTSTPLLDGSVHPCAGNMDPNDLK
eukprot:4410881-Amphidinium_carterae.1